MNSNCGLVRRIVGLGLALAFAVFCPSAIAQSASLNGKIQKLIDEVVNREEIPGMMAAISNHEGLLGISVTGLRKIGSDKPLTIDDKVHIGSCTKSMNCMMLATLIEQGELGNGNSASNS
jgi:CubicO group peptidase (beta-lactamase class C family)